ncbi:MFS transporter [Geminicoccaceae bacterium 1502E]|nr:MFS transporter [Geminicoccaceae bacterium 1502E]
MAAWLAWGLGALFYAYAFFQRVAPSVMVGELMRDFALGGAMLGSLSAAYFYAYAAVQIPVGVLLDRLGPRRMLVVAALGAGLGGLAFALAPSFGWAMTGRALIGAMVGVAYVATLKIASLWFAPARFGLLAGLTLAAGTMGAIGAQVPLAAGIAAFGWRPTMMAVAGAGLLMALAMLLFLRERPDGSAVAHGHGSLLADMMAILRRREIWLLVVATGAIGAPMLTFAGLWGVPYLVQVHGLDRTGAGLVTSLMLATWAVGGPLCGGLSDRLGRRRPVLLAGTVTALACWLLVLAVPQPPLVLLVPILALAGLAAGSMVAAFGLGRDLSGAARAGTVMGLINTSVLLFGAAMQTLMGLILDLGWQGELVEGARVYRPEAYRAALAIFGLVAATAAGAVAATREPRRAA